MGELSLCHDTNNLIPFQFDDHEIRVIDRHGEPWFIARDVARALGYVDTDDACRRFCKSLKMLKAGDSPGLNLPPRGLAIIPEHDVYRLIMRSRLPSAERFEELVVGEILPSIRKTGSYGLAVETNTHGVVTNIRPEFVDVLSEIMKGVVRTVVQDQLPQAIKAQLTNDPQLAAVRYIPALQVAINQGVKKRPRGLVQKISGSLARYCNKKGVVYLRDTRNVKLFPKEIISAWIADGGWQEIEDYLITKGIIRQLRMI